MVVVKTKFGETDGQEVSLYKITNKNQTSISVLSYAATWQNFEVVEDGLKHSLIEHFDNVADYVKTPYEVGKTIGRVAAGAIASLILKESSTGFTSSVFKSFDLNHKRDVL